MGIYIYIYMGVCILRFIWVVVGGCEIYNRVGADWGGLGRTQAAYTVDCAVSRTFAMSNKILSHSLNQSNPANYSQII